MTKFKSYNKEKNRDTVDKKAFLFGLMSVFLCGMGFSIISPVVPFLVEPYVSNTSEQAFFVTLLTSVYAVCVFFVAPGLGALSDRYGRRPILLICLLGSSIGYLIFGIGGSIWVLFLGRIIDGVTGGSISTIFAYFADITPKEERTKYFGWISAIAGIGAAIGPTLGGILAKFGYAVPMYFGAIITLLNFIYGILYMPESLHENNKLKKITLVRLNPFTQLMSVLSMKNLKRLLISAFLIWIPNGSLQSIFSLFTMDTFNWTPTLIGLMFSIMGIQDIISQGLIMPKLLMKLSDVKIAILGMVSEIIGYALIAASAIFTFYPFFIVGMFIFGFGDSIFGPSFNGMFSKSANSSEQGRIQGGSQALQSLARIIGPILGGQIYVSLGHSSPAFMGVILIALAIPILYKSTT
ncbi:TPA: MFS transporter [Clostridium perfringens]|uniref:MFS transporter n=1 Tax=Clostridium perfringens TaxID=1502 RepID=UPI000F5403AF|nr:MFS transporter [Clostridium perfringens]EJT6341113.1 MFS transporter [Clostridium perfringens]ELQ0171968.1 MFS transporter [Clostridium perfringens]UBK98677.1 MFS transporter [Clostridium perfringens]CAJ1611428.1 Tetracycline resistance protein, class C [Clostridium perfringens]BDC01350.1 tetracycline resistance MFS efflux pump [Clostridium perfringens E]